MNPHFPWYFFPSTSFTQAKMRLFQALGRGGAVLLKGNEKVGKTLFIRTFLEELQGEVYRKGYLPLSVFEDLEEFLKALPLLLNLPHRPRAWTLSELEHLLAEELHSGKFWILAFDPWRGEGALERELAPWIRSLLEHHRNLPLTVLFLVRDQGDSPDSLLEGLTPEVIELAPWDARDLERFWKQLLKGTGNVSASFPSGFFEKLSRESGGRLDLIRAFAEEFLFLSRMHQWEEMNDPYLLEPLWLLSARKFLKEEGAPVPALPTREKMERAHETIPEKHHKGIPRAKPSPEPPVTPPEEARFAKAAPSPPREEEALELEIPLKVEVAPEEPEEERSEEAPSVPTYSLDLGEELASLEQDLLQGEEVSVSPAPTPKEKKPSPPPSPPVSKPVPPKPTTPSSPPPQDEDLEVELLLKEVEGAASPAGEEDEVESLLKSLSPEEKGLPSPPQPVKPQAKQPPRSPKTELDEADEELERLLREIPEQ